LRRLVQVVQQREVAPSFVSRGPASLCLGLVRLAFGVELRVPRDVVIFTCACHSVLLFLFGLVASGLRILQDFAGICRGKRLIFFVFRVREGTLDQHIGVRIPGGQPSLNLYSCGYSELPHVRRCPSLPLCPHCVRIRQDWALLAPSGFNRFARANRKLRCSTHSGVTCPPLTRCAAWQGFDPHPDRALWADRIPNPASAGATTAI